MSEVCEVTAEERKALRHFGAGTDLIATRQLEGWELGYRVVTLPNGRQKRGRSVWLRRRNA